MNTFTLIIDTSIFGAGIALFGDQSRCIEFIQSSVDIADSARELPLMVEAGLKKIGIKQSAIKRVLVSQGPGSFTGIRVGMAYTFGFVAGRKLSGENSPLIAGVSSLVYFAKMLARGVGGQVVVFLPATKTSGYVVSVENNGVKTLAVDCLSEQTNQFFAQVSHLPWIMVGDWSILEEHGRKYGVTNLRAVSGRESLLLGLKELGEALAKNDGLMWSEFEYGSAPSPIYLRKSTVEEKALANR
jgi:tRNA A37 threonylcarbamoyladenosine modification protein TsaB